MRAPLEVRFWTKVRIDGTIVESVSPAPRLELFARRNRFGWHTWGNESIEHVDLGGIA